MKFSFPFIDDFSKFIYVKSKKNKDEFLDIFKHYKNEVENQTSRKIKTLRSDGGGEYFSTFLVCIC